MFLLEAVSGEGDELMSNNNIAEMLDRSGAGNKVTPKMIIEAERKFKDMTEIANPARCNLKDQYHASSAAILPLISTRGILSTRRVEADRISRVNHTASLLEHLN